ncbi:MAG: HEXXH motif-containing putative peptide modification protein, partial [Myxococcota bacterium]|nr:HEXXH motif-containing putative peptide modification protein [Myxococcota bacterium]
PRPGTRLALSARALSIAGGKSVPLEREALLALRDPRLEVADRFRALRPGIWLALADANPLALHEAHPDKQGNALSLGGHEEDEWARALDAALAIVERHLPGVIDELRALSTLLIPVGYEAEKHLSASYREYVGACYLTLHPDVRTMAEALVHEHQHNKANLASYHDALLENAQGTMVRSPVRPDLRPLWGVLLAVHAFVPVAELYRRMLAGGDAKVRARLADVVARNDEGLRTLREHAVPTRIGAAMLEELEMQHAQHLALELARPEGVSWEG